MIKNRSLAGAGYGTHITPLIAAVLATTGNILEMGMGDYSTPLLHEIIKYQRNIIGIDRHIFSMETNKEWLSNFIDLEHDWHNIAFVENWDGIEMDDNFPVSVVFIDHAPAARRVVDINIFRDQSEIIVVHDTEKVNYYGYEPTLSSFKYRKDYERYSKRTTLLSNFIDVTKIL